MFVVSEEAAAAIRYEQEGARMRPDHRRLETEAEAPMSDLEPRVARLEASVRAARRLCLAPPVAVNHPEWETTWTARNIEEYLGEVLHEPVTVTPEGCGAGGRAVAMTPWLNRAGAALTELKERQEVAQ